MMSNFWQKLVKGLAMTDSKCMLCGRDLFNNQTGFCPSCVKTVVFNNGHTCIRCGTKIAPTQSYCANCNFDKVYFDKAYSPFSYEEGIVKVIHRVKFGGYAGLLPTLAKYVYFTAEKYNVTFDEVCFVPMTQSGIKQRGYNQAQLLATHYCQLIGKTPLDVLEKVKETSRQEQLGRAERKKNVDNAYAVTNKQAVKSKTILLIDDVKTTGATLNNCAKALKKAGAQKVVCITLASTPEQFLYE